ncbi:hypothetical protein H4J02_03865 [Protaetiibacter sp. SSC-01]|uniref:phosphoribosyltransferase-like protein n=1 Tax=Protaetiibacter sp. SSC-01 TaxID=2759943 RepID=UPI001656B1C4|nr:hypothetical protein [Protaetiibacter sp. SSC-01]QNO38174.1 hypothetical protein H4J02_03865 [Protaetiibacter sp. SSC-01]
MSADEILDLRAYYTRVQLWPDQPFDIRPREWLGNFHDARDFGIASALLDSFIHFSEKQTFKLFESAFASLAATDFVRSLPGSDLAAKWRAFRGAVLVSFPEGDDESASGSGYVFVRQARQRLRIQESRLVDPSQLVSILTSGAGSRPIVLVDDIVGSGDQFLETWSRPYDVGGQRITLRDAVANSGSTLFYAPALCTEEGYSRIAVRAPDVVISPAHMIPRVYGAGDPETILVPDHLRPELHDFIIRTSARIGVSESQAYGHRGFGLAISFDHSMPDLTLPIFWAERAGWTPLRTRR